MRSVRPLVSVGLRQSRGAACAVAGTTHHTIKEHDVSQNPHDDARPEGEQPRYEAPSYQAPQYGTPAEQTPSEPEAVNPEACLLYTSPSPRD